MSDKLKKLINHIYLLNQTIKEQQQLINDNNIEYFIKKVDDLGLETINLKKVNSRIQDQLEMLMGIVNGDNGIDKKKLAAHMVQTERKYVTDMNHLEQHYQGKIKKLQSDHADEYNKLKMEHVQEMDGMKIEHSRQVQGITMKLTTEKSKVEEILLKVQKEKQNELIQHQNAATVAIDALKNKFEEKYLKLQERHDTQIKTLKGSHDSILKTIHNDHLADIASIEQKNNKNRLDSELKHQEELEKLQQAHSKDNEKLESFLKTHHTNEMNQIKQKYELELHSTKNTHQLEIEKLNMTIKSTSEDYDKQIQEITSHYDQKINNLEQSYKNEINTLTIALQEQTVKYNDIENELIQKNDHIEQLRLNIEHSHLQLNSVVSNKHKLESKIVDLTAKSTALHQHYQHSLKMLQDKEEIVQDGQSKLKCVTEQLSELSTIKKTSNHSYKSFSVFAEDFDDWIDKKDMLTSLETIKPSENDNIIITGMELD